MASLTSIEQNHVCGGSPITFRKYHGCGNDFLMVDNMSGSFDDKSSDVNLIRSLCHRRFGVGADGLIEVRRHPEYAFEMKYYNADGQLATFCGNGSRCALAFARELELLEYNEATFLASDGIHHGIYDDINEVVHIKCQDVESTSKADERNYFVHNGSPHHIRLVDDLRGYDVLTEGKKIRNDEQYRSIGGTNANFVQADGPFEIRVRTFERGVEDETLSCGSGSVAASLVDASIRRTDGVRVDNAGDSCCARPNCFVSNSNHRHVVTEGGELLVTFETTDYEKFKEIYLIGPAVEVFTGTCYPDQTHLRTAQKTTMSTIPI